MAKIKLTALALILGCACAYAQDWEWSKTAMDGSRVGASIPDTFNVPEALGRVEGDTYYAPNGKVYSGGSLPEVARLMLEAQTAMAPVKEVIGHSLHAMPRQENELKNMIVDRLMVKAEEVTGLKVDAGVVNHGGVRYDLPEGKIIMDDIISMLPFKNYICVVKMSGRTLKEKIDRMAESRIEVIGGLKVYVDGHKVVKTTVGGRKIRDNRMYNVATIDFLLNGGDGVKMAQDAVDLITTDVLIREALVDYIRELSSEGKAVSYTNERRTVSVAPKERKK